MGIFDQIKNAFSRGDEVPEDKEFARPEPAQTTVQQPEPAPPPTKTYTVQSGDTLWKIASDIYGDGEQYVKLFEANSEWLSSPERILPGQELRIP